LLEHDHGCSSNSSYAHNDPAHTTRRTEVRLSRVAARAGHDLGHCCCGWARWGLVERESEVAVGSSCPGVKMVEWASKRSASIGVSAADGKLQARPTNARVAATLPRHCIVNVIHIDTVATRLLLICPCNTCTARLTALPFVSCFSPSARQSPLEAPHDIAAPRPSITVLHVSMLITATGRVAATREP
jgi:hypothetical protein